jgi:hypothetical protein
LSEFAAIKDIRERFGKLSPTGKQLCAEWLAADVLAARTAKARAAIGKGKRRRSQTKPPQNDQPAKGKRKVEETVAVEA